MSTQTITADNLQTTINDNDIVILDFWADWCGPCKSFAPVFEQASEEHSDIVFGKIDTEDQQQLAGAFGITSVPTLMAFREGVGVFRQAGALPAPQLQQLIDGVRGLDMDQVHQQVEEQKKQQAEQAAQQQAQAPQGQAQAGAGRPGTSPTDI